MYTLRSFLVLITLLSITLSSCGSPSTPIAVDDNPVDVQPTDEAVGGAFTTGVYPNLFADYLGKNDGEIQAKIDAIWEQLFYGDDAAERVYYPVGSDMAYISDIANADVRSEGMSYGMMIAVQLNKKDEFDRLWKWAKTYMYQKDGGYAGYFAWHCKTDGTPLAANPASDGEVWFITALFFADGRWGSGEGIYNYRAEANSILNTAIHAEGRGDLATDLFDLEEKQVVFVPQLGKNSQFTDPSYHMPHFYELWARWADKDNEFWADAVTVSREYLPKSVHPETGLAPNYSEFDGKPVDDEYNGNFRYDAFRVGANVGMDYVWFQPSEWHVEQSNRLLKFFTSQGINDYKAEYYLTGEPQVGHRSTGLIATNAVAALAADREIGEPFVQALWDAEVPVGQYRYYDGLLMLLGMLQVSGNFQIYEPGTAPEGQVLPTPTPEISGLFMPPSGRALLLIGQNVKSIDEYFAATVTAPGGVAWNTDLQMKKINDLDYLAGKYPKSTLSVGVDMKGTLDSIVDGKAAAKIDVLIDKLISYDRPVYLRLGFGFDDPANKYTPDVFVSAWKKFHEQIQAKGGTNVALVWESASSCETAEGENPLESWYPGDEFVDWVGMRYGNQPPDCILEFSRNHLKPVIIAQTGPSTPDLEWDAWFGPFFEFVNENNDVIRAVTYINENGSRIQLNAEIVKRWKTETKQSFWLRGGPDLFKSLKQ